MLDTQQLPSQILKHCLCSGSSMRARIVVQEHHAILCVQKTDQRSHFTVGGIVDSLVNFKHALKLFK
jgi:hypothetical protein